MKINLAKEQPTFTPVTVSITLESEQEFRALRELSFFTETVPDTVFPSQEDDALRSTLSKMLQGVWSQLCQSF